MSDQKTRGIIICQRHKMSHPRLGAVLTYRCSMCSERLQIAPDSATRIDTENLIPLCQKCGITVAKRLEAVGHPLDVLATRNMLPKLARKFDSGDETAAFISGHELHCAHCRALLSIADAAAHVCPEPKR